MRTIPVACANRLLADRADLRAAINGCGRRVGERTEVDLEAVRGVHPTLCQVLASYHSRTTHLWSAMRAGTPGGGAYDVTRRPLVRHRQVTGKVGRRDLREVLELLTDLPGIGDVVTSATDTSPDFDALTTAVTDLGGLVLGHDGGCWSAQVPLEGLAHWSAELGGVATINEVGRWLRLDVRHAAGLDRRVRRLARVDVLVDELWADPAPYVAALPAA